MMSLSCRTWFELTEVVCTVSSLPVGSGRAPVGDGCEREVHTPQTARTELRLEAVSNRNSVRAVCGVPCVTIG